MALERKWTVVLPRAFAADGNAFGLITLATTAGFKVKQSAYLLSTSQPRLPVQVKRVISPTQLVVGAIDNKISSWLPLNITAYTVADGASIGAEEQDKNKIGADDIESAVYEADPTVAKRVVFVDQFGNFYDENNPLPATFEGTISIGQVEIKGPSGDVLEVNPDGSINVHILDTPATGQTVISKYNEVFNVASGVTTTIVTYTVPALKTAVLERIDTSGENVGRYDITLNGSPFDTQRSYFGSEFNTLFEYTTGSAQGLVLNAGDVIAVTILHNRPFVGNFTARIQVLEIS